MAAAVILDRLSWPHPLRLPFFRCRVGRLNLAGDGQAPSPSNPAPETPVPGADDGASPRTDDFKAYSDCLDDARPEDTEALQRCADLLRP